MPFFFLEQKRIRPKLSITKLSIKKLEFQAEGVFTVRYTELSLKRGPTSTGKLGSKIRIMFSVVVCFGLNDSNCVITIVLRPVRQKTR